MPLANFRTSMYRERIVVDPVVVMNSSGGNILGQVQVPMEDSSMDVPSAGAGEEARVQSAR